MDTSNLSDTEQRVQGFQSRIRVDYTAKIQEAAKLTDEVAKLQTRLLDVEYENNVLRQQLVIAKNEILELKKSATLMTASKKDNSAHVDTISVSETLNLPLKRERSPSLEIVDMPKHSSKKLRGKERAERSTSSHLTVDCQIVPSVVSVGRPLQGSQIVPMNTQIKLPNTLPCEYPRPQIIATSRRPRSRTDSSDEDTTLPRARPAFYQRSDSAFTQPVAVLKSSHYSKEKKAENVFSLPKSIVNKYLESVDNFLNIYPSPLDLEVSRKFLRARYGGNASKAIAHTQKNNPSGSSYRRLIFLELDLNPSMPSHPGESGLIVAGRHQLVSNPPWTLFCRYSKIEELWTYLGEYENEFVENMPSTCFGTQSPTVKRQWAERLLKEIKFGAYCAIRARIALRLATIIPMNDDEEERKVVLQEVNLIRKGKERAVSEEDIITAFSNGEEEVDIIGMRCIKYDHVFANDIKKHFTKYTSVAQEENRSDSEEAGSERTPYDNCKLFSRGSESTQ